MAMVKACGAGGDWKVQQSPGRPWWEFLWATVQGWEASLDAWNNWEESSLFRAAQMEGRVCQKVQREEASDDGHLQQSNFAVPIFLPVGLGRNLFLSLPKSRAACICCS